MKRTTWMLLAGALAGAIGGWLYYANVGCANGSCAITSNPWNSAAYGALLGATLLSFFTPAKPRATSPNEQQHNNDLRS